MINKLKLLRIVLILGALYYLIGSFVHFFGLTLFSFFDAKLYAPYHDSIIALAAVIFAFFLLTIAKNPVKNIDTLKIVIIGEILASIFSIAILWKVDFINLGGTSQANSNCH